MGRQDLFRLLPEGAADLQHGFVVLAQAAHAGAGLRRGAGEASLRSAVMPSSAARAIVGLGLVVARSFRATGDKVAICDVDAAAVAQRLQGG